MYTLKLKDGDLDLTDRRGVVLTGKDKLVQQLSNWISEHKGVDRFHEGYGCGLQDMVGGPHTELFLRTVETEVRSTIQAYMQVQTAEFEKEPRLFEREEVIYQMLSVTAYYVDVSSVRVDIWIRTLAGSDVQLDTEMDA